MNKIIIILVMTISMMGLWTWFIEFEGWDTLFEYSQSSPRLRRIKILLDHPITYYKWRSTMKIYDPLYLGYWFRPNNLKVYSLFFDPADLREINAYLPESFSKGGLTKDNRIKIEGELLSDGVSRKTVVSYHGDTFNHWSGNKKSWKLEFDSGEELYLIIPSDRGYFSESLSNYRAKKLGLLSQYDDWIWLKINNEDAGVYYVTGAWNEYWLEKSGKQVSQLVGELDYQTGDEIFPVVWNGVWNWKFYAYRTDRKFPNSYFLQQFLDAVNQSSGAEFDKAISQIVSSESLSRWKAISILMNSYHTDDVHNWRMWLNPESLQFELIPIDKYISLKDRNSTSWPFILDGAIDRLSAKIHSSAELTLAIDQALWGYVKDDTQLMDDLRYWDNLNNWLMPHMYADRNKFFGNISLRKIRSMRQQIISQYKNINTYLMTEDLRAHIEKIGNNSVLVISSHQPTQVELESVVINGQKIYLDRRVLFSRQVTRREGETYIFDRQVDEMRVAVPCLSTCQVEVTGKNLVTGVIQRISI